MTLFRMFQRRGTTAQWEAANTVLAVGEIGFDYEANVIKIGDGLTAWNSLTSLDGKSAYEIAVSNGFEGDEAAWLLSLAGLPSQANNSGKFLTTNGTIASWSTIDLSTKQDKVSGVSDTEIGYLDGVTSSIQTQLGNKQDKVANVSDTEIGHLDGVTSAIQTQLNTKAPLASPSFTGSVNGNPGNPSSDNAAKALGYVGLPQVQVFSSKTLSSADAGKHQWVEQGGLTIQLPSSETGIEVGTTFVIINNGNIQTTIQPGNEDLRLAGTSTNGSRTLGNYGVATIVKVKSATWVISGNGLT
jgi:hypothetical protein